MQSNTYSGHTIHQRHILVGVTGSVAATKLLELVTGLQTLGEVQVVYTSAAKRFFCSTKLSQSGVSLWTDGDEWDLWQELSSPILHIKLRRWADIFILAPLTANTLAKMANGLCDNLLTSILRAWDPSRPILAAPAMNTYMWHHPLTQRHIALIHDIFTWIEWIGPIEKRLACGDIGMGGMMGVSEIIEKAAQMLERAKKENNQVFFKTY
ncbi:hypothetical protein PMAC_001120 [Pneumocystis sp. 'macacae']|nr:hypothetical protein PMAC_001120 [Pneumocystis sp. 'macacae']